MHCLQRQTPLKIPLTKKGFEPLADDSNWLLDLLIVDSGGKWVKFEVI
jgi:hypothetical protein